jgi:pimeloyl-ACP methyl ester carboxylesterase
MKTLWWQTVGTGNCHLVLLHGWGLNAEVWRCISEELASQFTVHLVDLPGYGRSHGYGAMTLDDMAEQVLEAAPQKAISHRRYRCCVITALDDPLQNERIYRSGSGGTCSRSDAGNAAG